MWSYYGSKTKLVDLYPPPKTDKIIEPFCGSAKYSLKYWNKQVLLMDKYSVVVELWKWLQKQSRNEILDLPNMEKGDDLRLLDLPKEAKYLIGFCINRGSVAPKNIASGFNNWNEDKIRIADNVFKIKHWEIVQGSYEDLPNENATWFIDPPYEFGGEHYKESTANIDFGKLGDWCKSRNGQVIVCENTKAQWLDFKPMKDFFGAYSTTTEAIWSNMPTNYDNVQQTLF